MDRRSLILGGVALVAAPAIVRISSLMPMIPTHRLVLDRRNGFSPFVGIREFDWDYFGPEPEIPQSAYDWAERERRKINGYVEIGGEWYRWIDAHS